MSACRALFLVAVLPAAALAERKDEFDEFEGVELSEGRDVARHLSTENVPKPTWWKDESKEPWLQDESKWAPWVMLTHQLNKKTDPGTVDTTSLYKHQGKASETDFWNDVKRTWQSKDQTFPKVETDEKLRVTLPPDAPVYKTTNHLAVLAQDSKTRVHHWHFFVKCSGHWVRKTRKQVDPKFCLEEKKALALTSEDYSITEYSPDTLRVVKDPLEEAALFCPVHQMSEQSQQWKQCEKVYLNIREYLVMFHQADGTLYGDLPAYTRALPWNDYKKILVPPYGDGLGCISDGFVRLRTAKGLIPLRSGEAANTNGLFSPYNVQVDVSQEDEAKHPGLAQSIANTLEAGCLPDDPLEALKEIEMMSVPKKDRDNIKLCPVVSPPGGPVKDKIFALRTAEDHRVGGLPTYTTLDGGHVMYFEDRMQVLVKEEDKDKFTETSSWHKGHGNFVIIEETKMENIKSGDNLQEVFTLWRGKYADLQCKTYVSYGDNEFEALITKLETDTFPNFYKMKYNPASDDYEGHDYNHFLTRRWDDSQEVWTENNRTITSKIEGVKFDVEFD